MYCGKCGKEIADNIKFCPYCGADQNVSQREALPNSKPTLPEIPKERKRKTGSQ